MKLIIGTANFLNNYGFTNHHIIKKEIIEILGFASNNNVSGIDTSNSYDDFKKIFSSKKYNKFELSSKYSFKRNILKNKLFEKNFISFISKNLKQFNRGYFYNYFIHNFDDIDLNSYKKIIKVLKLLKKRKKIKYIGISLYDPKSLKKKINFDDIDIIQVPISIFDRRFIDKKIINFLIKKKIKIQARSIFLQGLIFKSPDDIINLKFVDKKVFKSFHLWSIENNISKIKSSLNFIKTRKCLDSVVVGVDNLHHLKEIINLFKFRKLFKVPKKIFSKKNSFLDIRKWKN